MFRKRLFLQGLVPCQLDWQEAEFRRLERASAEVFRHPRWLVQRVEEFGLIHPPLAGGGGLPERGRCGLTRLSLRNCLTGVTSTPGVYVLSGTGIHPGPSVSGNPNSAPAVNDGASPPAVGNGYQWPYHVRDE